MPQTPLMSQIMPVSFSFAPQGWAQCNGQFLPINQNQALFSLLGTTYGGNGQTTFALPDLRGRTAMHIGNGHTQGEKGGQEVHTLTLSELPTHLHVLNANSGQADTAGAAVPPTGNNFAQAFAVPAGGGNTPVTRFASGSPTAVMSPNMVGNIGGSQPHENRQPYSVINFCIALLGVFPSRN